jgi:hypothetical protein
LGGTKQKYKEGTNTRNCLVKNITRKLNDIKSDEKRV